MPNWSYIHYPSSSYYIIS